MHDGNIGITWPTSVIFQRKWNVSFQIASNKFSATSFKYHTVVDSREVVRDRVAPIKEGTTSARVTDRIIPSKNEQTWAPGSRTDLLYPTADFVFLHSSPWPKGDDSFSGRPVKFEDLEHEAPERPWVDSLIREQWEISMVSHRPKSSATRCLFSLSGWTQRPWRLIASKFRPTILRYTVKSITYVHPLPDVPHFLSNDTPTIRSRLSRFELLACDMNYYYMRGMNKIGIRYKIVSSEVLFSRKSSLESWDIFGSWRV